MIGTTFRGVVSLATFVLGLDLDFDPVLVDLVDFCDTVAFLPLTGTEVVVGREEDSCRAVSGTSSSLSEKTTLDLRCLFAGGEAIHNGASSEKD